MNCNPRRLQSKTQWYLLNPWKDFFAFGLPVITEDEIFTSVIIIIVLLIMALLNIVVESLPVEENH